MIAVEHVSKSFGRRYALDDVSLGVPHGAVTGLAGSNGAGKTTLLSIMAGFIRPDSGEVRYEGRELRSADAHVLGVQIEDFRSYDTLSAHALLTTSAMLYGVSRREAMLRSESILTVLGLEADMHRTVEEFSTGMRKKVHVGAALIHAPRAILLDEPLEAVDPPSQVVIIDILREFARRGGAVLLSTHNLEMIERACDSYVILDKGKIVAEGAVDEISHSRRLHQIFAEATNAQRVSLKGLGWLTPFSR